MKILVTGSEGFIGKNLCRYLIGAGEDVFGLDLKEKESDINYCEYYKCDLKSDEISTIIERSKFDAVVHLASDMRHEPYTKEVLNNNLVGAENLLINCEKNNVSVFVQLSSLPVIGRPIMHPVTEEHPLNPPTVYHITKASQELLANYAHQYFGLRTVSLRITAPVGKGMNQKTIFPTFVSKAIKGEDIVIYGKGTRKQTYIHVDDIAQAIYKCIKGNACGVYNLSSNNLISNSDLAKKCIEVLQSNSKIVFNGEDDNNDDVVWDVSFDKLKSAVGYDPKISIEEAISEYARFIS